MHPRRSRQFGLTLIETIIALVLIAVLLSILLPALAAARINSHRDHCSDNLRSIGAASETYLEEHNHEFPYVPLQPAWHYAGMRFSRVDGSAHPDYNRPLTQYLDLFKTRDYSALCVCCPADRGISATATGTGTGERTAFESYGNSYRAVASIFDARSLGITDESRGLRRYEISASPSSLLLYGDPVWYEVVNSTGRHADWHEEPNAGNLLLLDGSTHFMRIPPRGGPIVFDPLYGRATNTTRPSVPEDQVPIDSP